MISWKYRHTDEIVVTGYNQWCKIHQHDDICVSMFEVFFPGDPCEPDLILRHDDEEALSRCTPLQKFDYFSGSEWPFILSLLLLVLVLFCEYYRQTSNISRTLVGNKIVDHSDVVGASPVGTAPATSPFST